MFIYVLMYGSNEEHTCSWNIPSYHIALYFIHGCCCLLANPQTYQYIIVCFPRRGMMQLTASYLVGYGGRPWHMHCTWINCELYIQVLDIYHGVDIFFFMRCCSLFIYFIRVNIWNDSCLWLYNFLHNGILNNPLKLFTYWNLFLHPSF